MNVERIINPHTLAKRCSQSIEDFYCYGDVDTTPSGPLIYKDNGAKILGVAHMDVVMEITPRIYEVDNSAIVRAPQLDDRLGVYILLDVLPKLGIEFDLLLTDSEEIGQSTAQYFIPEKDYNWMFEFDRNGLDVVMYEYEETGDAYWCRKRGWTLGSGSFSDISWLNHVGVKGFNFGCGYYQQHTENCHANMRDVADCVNRFQMFYEMTVDEELSWTPKSRYSRRDRWNSNSNFSHYGGNNYNSYGYADDEEDDFNWENWTPKKDDSEEAEDTEDMQAVKEYLSDQGLLEDLRDDLEGEGSSIDDETGRVITAEEWLDDPSTLDRVLGQQVDV